MRRESLTVALLLNAVNKNVIGSFTFTTSKETEPARRVSFYAFQDDSVFQVNTSDSAAATTSPASQQRQIVNSEVVLSASYQGFSVSLVDLNFNIEKVRGRSTFDT